MYALGLVVHEMLNGKRVFEGKSLNELRAIHEETKPPGLSASAIDVDPSFERVVMRCLSRSPEDRPASALVVLASRPGGDPLQAALLAGETPSPEMVAAASKVGGLRPAVAWACLSLVILGLVGAGLLSRWTAYYRHVPFEKPRRSSNWPAWSIRRRTSRGGSRTGATRLPIAGGYEAIWTPPVALDGRAAWRFTDPKRKDGAGIAQAIDGIGGEKYDGARPGGLRSSVEGRLDEAFLDDDDLLLQVAARSSA